jgi:hypothetical protein
MNRRTRLAVALVCALWAARGASVQAQAFGYPWGFGGFGWGGWGASSGEGDLAHGLGAFAAGAGFYNKQTAIADAINTDTVIRWNEYFHEAQMSANRRFAQRRDLARDRVLQAAEATRKRLRDNPDPRDVFRGDALNVALDEINDPRVYRRDLRSAKVKIGGEKIRTIPFQYAAAAITVSIDQLANGPLPAALLGPEFQADREAIKALDRQIVAQVEDGKDPDPETVKKLLGAIYTAEENAAKIWPRNSRERNEADRYLKALHGLVAMLKTPAIDLILAGVENRPDATLGDLLSFMGAFNLRFGVASTPQQQQVYSFLYPKLVQVRDEVATALATTAAPKTNGHEPEDFFSGMSYDDLVKKAPRSQAAGDRPQN